MLSPAARTWLYWTFCARSSIFLLIFVMGESCWVPLEELPVPLKNRPGLNSLLATQARAAADPSSCKVCREVLNLLRLDHLVPLFEVEPGRERFVRRVRGGQCNQLLPLLQRVQALTAARQEAEAGADAPPASE